MLFIRFKQTNCFRVPTLLAHPSTRGISVHLVCRLLVIIVRVVCWQVQAVVPGGVLVHAGHDVQLRHARPRQEHRHGGHGRQTPARPHLHRRAYRSVIPPPYTDHCTWVFLSLKSKFLTKFNAFSVAFVLSNLTWEIETIIFLDHIVLH